MAARQVMAAAAAHLTPLALELGGKSPNIVCADADLDAAATLVARAGTGLLSGQGCALPTRTYVHEDVYDDFVARVLPSSAALAVGDPLDPADVRRSGGDRGGHASAHPRESSTGRSADGATLLAGGGRAWAATWPTAGSWPRRCSATSTTAATWPGTRCSGRCRPCCGSPPTTRQLARANDSPYGLAAYVYTADPGRLDRFVDRHRGGRGDGQRRRALGPATPFGGVKQSGFGREGGRAGYEEMVRGKTVLADR